MIILIYLIIWLSLFGVKNALKVNICENYIVNKSSERVIYEVNKKSNIEMFNLKIETNNGFPSFDYKNKVIYCKKCITTRHDEIILLHEFFHYIHSKSLKDRTIDLYCMFKIISLIMFPLNTVLIIFLKDLEFLFRLNVVLLILNIATVFLIALFENETNNQLLKWYDLEFSKSEKIYIRLNQYFQVLECSFLVAINFIVLISLK